MLVDSYDFKIDLFVYSLNSHQRLVLAFLRSPTLNIRYKKGKDLKTKGLVEIENFCLEKNENST